MAKSLLHTDYLERVYRVNSFIKVVNKAVTILRKYRRKHPFDAIAFTGTSGAALAYPISYKLGIPLICVRKSRSNSHFYGKVEGYLASKYIIVDDFKTNLCYSYEKDL